MRADCSGEARALLFRFEARNPITRLFPVLWSWSCFFLFTCLERDERRRALRVSSRRQSVTLFSDEIWNHRASFPFKWTDRFLNHRDTTSSLAFLLPVEKGETLSTRLPPSSLRGWKWNFFLSIILSSLQSSFSWLLSRLEERHSIHLRERSHSCKTLCATKVTKRNFFFEKVCRKKSISLRWKISF